MKNQQADGLPIPGLETLDAVVAYCKSFPGFLVQFDRLCKSSFTMPPLVQQIDRACGKREEDEAALRVFVAENIVAPIRARMAQEDKR